MLSTGTFCLECVTGHDWGGGGVGRRVGKGLLLLISAHPWDEAEPVAGPVRVTIINSTCHFGLWWWLSLFLAWPCPHLSSSWRDPGSGLCCQLVRNTGPVPGPLQ